MKSLYIMKTEPGTTTKALMAAFDGSQGEDATLFELYGKQPDYDRLVDLIFEHDRVVCWW